MIRIPIYDFIVKEVANITIATLVIVVAGFTLTDNHRVTDFIHDFIYVALLFYFRNDRDLFVVLLCILLGRFVAQALLLFPIESSYVLVKCFYYLLVVFCCYISRKDKLAIFSLMLLFCMLVSELYWWIIDYKHTPQFTYYAAAIAIDLIIRKVILQRTVSLDVTSYLPSLRLFLWQTYTLTGVYIIVLSLTIFEYFVRHILDVQILVIYNAYSYTMFMINTLVLWSVLNYALKKVSFFKA
jgi:hypothetical protein